MNRYLLFTNPSFAGGVARLLDLGSTMNDYNCFLFSDEADYWALKSDREAIGIDLENRKENRK
jgi:hypothetical protein